MIRSPKRGRGAKTVADEGCEASRTHRGSLPVRPGQRRHRGRVVGMDGFGTWNCGHGSNNESVQALGRSARNWLGRVRLPATIGAAGSAVGVSPGQRPVRQAVMTAPRPLISAAAGSLPGRFRRSARQSCDRGPGLRRPCQSSRWRDERGHASRRCEYVRWLLRRGG